MLNPILKTEAGKVLLTYPTMPEFELKIDFNPIIQQFRLSGSFCLLHWQAKPFGERRWGIYDAKTDSYVSDTSDKFHLLVIPQLLQVDEKLIKTVPTAVLYFPRSKIVENGYYSIVPV